MLGKNQTLQLRGWVVTLRDDVDDAESMARALQDFSSSPSKAWKRFLELVGRDRSHWNRLGYVARPVTITVSMASEEAVEEVDDDQSVIFRGKSVRVLAGGRRSVRLVNSQGSLKVRVADLVSFVEGLARASYSADDSVGLGSPKFFFWAWKRRVR